MLAFVLLAAVAASPDIPRSARLLDDAPLLAQADVAPPLPGPSLLPPVSPQQIQVDIDALRRQRPSLGAGIALVSTGGGLALLGGYFFLVNGFASTFTGGFASSPLFPLGVISLGIGVPLLVIGVWLLYNRIEQRQRIDTEIKLLREELKGRPRPAVAELPTVTAPMTVARF